MLKDINHETRLDETKLQYKPVRVASGLFEGCFRLKNVYSGSFEKHVFRDIHAVDRYVRRQGWTLIE